MHLLITDSGLGGLSVCAETEKALRRAAADSVRITYFNAWPEEVSGYNDMPDIDVRAAVFDRALTGMAALKPAWVVIACNTLSIVYEHTAFRRSTTIPVVGIVNTGVDLFVEALDAVPDASIVLFGTRTTIESGSHRARLIARGIAPERIAAVPCHGLARAIEMEPDGETIGRLIEQCSAAASRSMPAGKPLYLGVCCTHYTYVRDQMRDALERHSRRPVQTLDPNDRLAADIAGRIVGVGQEGRASAAPTVAVVSKVTMDLSRRQSIARRVQEASPATAAALLSYTRVPDLF
jgi:glutamate racemase